METDFLKNKVRSGLRWGALDILSNKFIAIISSIILTRLLLPSDFGVYAISMSVIAMANVFTFTGFHGAYIQKNDANEEDLNVIWTVELIKSIILWFVVFNSASLIGNLMSNVDVVPIIKFISFVFPLQGLQNIGLLVLRKNINMKLQFIFNIIPQIFTSILSIILAFYLQNIWAIVYSFILGAIVKLILSYLIHPYRPIVHIDFKKIKNLFKFGRWVLFSVIISFFKKQGITLFIGGFFGVNTLGYYNRSSTFSINIFSQLKKIFSKIIFPGLSKVQNNKKLIQKSLFDVLKSTTFLISIIIGFCFAFTGEFVSFVIGDRWLAIIPYIKIMLLISFFDIILIIFKTFLLAIGRPAINTKIDIIILLIIVIGIGLSIYHREVTGLLYAILIANIVALIYTLEKISNILILDIKMLIVSVIPSLSILVSIILSSKYIINNSSNIYYFLSFKTSLLILICIMVFLICEKWLGLKFYKLISIISGKNYSNNYVRIMKATFIYPDQFKV